MLEGLRGFFASGAGGGVMVIPRQVGAEVTFSRSHLGKPTRIEFVEAPKRMGLEGGGVWIS